MIFAIHQITSSTNAKYEFTINNLIGSIDDSTLDELFRSLVQNDYTISIYRLCMNLEDYIKETSPINTTITITTLYEQTYVDSNSIDLFKIESTLETNYPELFI